MTDDEHLRHIQVLEAQVENNREVASALRELEENLVARIDDKRWGDHGAGRDRAHPDRRASRNPT
jgi:hypothetical protein